MNGIPVVGAAVLVQTYPALATATIYSDNGVTLAVNPLTTDGNGRFGFYAADGRYSLTISKLNLNTQTVSDILLEDPQDTSGGLVEVQTTIAALNALAGTQLAGQVQVLGYYAVGDGGGGLFRWNGVDATADNGGTVIAPTVGSGRWNRVYSGEIDCRWFGLKGDTSDDSPAGQKLVNWAQILGEQIYFPAAPTRWTFASSLTFDVTKGPLSIRGAGKYSTVMRYTGTGTWLSATGGSVSLQIFLSAFTLQLNGAAGIGVDMSQCGDSTVRSVRFGSSTGGTNGTGINARPTNNAWAPFFNVLDDCTFDTLTSGIILDSTVGNAPNRWRIIAPTFLGGTSGIKIGTNSTQLVAGTDIIAPYFDQLTGAGIALGANSDRTTIVAARQETAAGGSLFSIDPAANRTTIVAYQSHAGTTGSSALGIRAMMLGLWDEGLVWTGSTVTTQNSIDRSSDTLFGATGDFTHTGNIFLDANGTRDFGKSNVGLKRLYSDYTNTATVGNVTINKMSGRVNLGAGQTALTLTNSLITAASHIFLNPDSAPGNVVAVMFFAVPAGGGGSCTINAVPAVTNQTAIDFLVVNAD